MTVVVAYSGAPLLLGAMVALVLAMIVLAVYLGRRPSPPEEETLATPDEVPGDEYLSRRRLR